MENKILAKGVEITTSIFDDSREGKPLAMGGRLDFEIPKECDLIILMGNKGGGYVPYRCLLPHQVYMDDIRDAFDKEHFEVINIVPISSKSVFPIVYKNEYGRSRWEIKK